MTPAHTFPVGPRAHLRSQRGPPRGERVDLRANSVRHDVRVSELPADVADARQPRFAVVGHVVFQVLREGADEGGPAGGRGAPGTYI